MRSPTLAAALALALGISACGSANSAATLPSQSAGAGTVPPVQSRTVVVVETVTSGTETAAETASATVTTQSITAPDSGGAGLGTTTTQATVEPLCDATDLRPSAVSPNSAPGLTAVGLTLTNTGTRTCRTGGWPGVAFVDTAGSVLSTTPTRTTSDELGTAPNLPLTLAPGETASFRVTVKRDPAQSGADCAVSAVQIIAPDDTATQRVTIPDGPLELCGAAEVTPLEPGQRGTGQ